MSAKFFFIRLTGSCLLLAVSTVFCKLFSFMKLNQMIHGMGVTAGDLPLPCTYFLQCSGWMMGLPVVLFGVGFLLLRRSKELPSSGLEFLIQVALIFSAFLVAGCILAWQLPTYYPVALID